MGNPYELTDLVRIRCENDALVTAARERLVRAGKTSLAYHGAARHIAAQSFDLALAHVTPPDAQGRCSLGVSSDFATLAWRTARRRVLVVNPDMPRLPRALSIALDEAGNATPPLATLLH